MEDDRILYTKEDGIGLITFNRPDRMNAVTDDMLVTLGEIIGETILDDEVRVVIVTGNGRAFCGGTDVSNLGRDEVAAGQARAARAKAQPQLPDSPLPAWTFTRIPKPTIAAVNGAAVGMGAEWTSQCDIRIASVNARFGWVFSLRGLTPDTGAGPYLLPYIVGLGKSLEMMYSGEIIDADEALRVGLVSQVVAADDLLPTARELAAKLMRGAPLSHKGIKELTYGSLEWPPSVHRAETGQRFRDISLTDDCKEGVQSFLEKRPPAWKGK